MYNHKCVVALENTLDVAVKKILINIQILYEVFTKRNTNVYPNLRKRSC